MGGANNQKFGREGDLNSDPADCFFIKANNCSGNIYQINQNKFTIQYGHHTSNRASQHKVMSIAGTFPIGTDIKEVDGNLIDQLDELITSRKSNKPVSILNCTTLKVIVSFNIMISVMFSTKVLSSEPK